MKRVIVFILLLIAGLQAARAQDIITTKRGEDVQAKVLEVSQTEVKYKAFSNPDGPVYTLPTREILIVRYENGEKDIFGEEESSENYFVGDLAYRDYKNKYNPAQYISRPDDPYSPLASGLASFFIPGLGQCICGEWGRGVGFFLGTEAATYLSLTYIIYNVVTSSEDYYNYYYGDNQHYQSSNNGSFVTMLLALLGTEALHIWNIFDAARVAKVKNMYFQDVNGHLTSLDLNIEPYLNLAPASYSAGNQMVGGLSIKLNF